MNLDESKSKKQQKRIHISFLKKIASIVLESRLCFGTIVIALVINRLIMVLFPFGIKYGIDAIQGKAIQVKSFGFVMLEMPHVALWHILLALLILFCIQFVLRYSQIVLTSRLGHRWTRDIRNDLFSHLMKQRMSFFDANKTGQLSNRVVYDTKLLNRFLVYNMPAMFSDIVLIFLILVLGACMMNFKLAILNLIILGLLVFSMMMFRRSVEDLFRFIRRKMAEMNVFLQNFMAGVRLIRAFQRESILKKRFASIQKDYVRAYLKAIKVYSFYFAGVDLLGNLIRVCIILIASIWIWQGSLELSSLIAFLFYFPIFAMSVRSISEHYQMSQLAFASGDFIMELLEKDSSIKVLPSLAKHSTQCHGHIEFKNVSLEYQSGYRVLDDVSFKIKKGERVALIGETGSGKTSIVSLLTRLYEPSEGNIFIDGIDIREIRLDILRKWVAYVPQDAFIFSDTVRRNLTLFDNTISDAQIQNACHHFNLPFCSQLEKQYHTKLGEKGHGISFGERQLISLIRAFVRDFRILVLDEVTSNLNVETQQQIQSNLDMLIGNRTTVMIAHRWFPLNKVDRVFSLNSGKLNAPVQG